MAGEERHSDLLPAVVPIILQQQPETLPFFLLESNHQLSKIAAQFSYRRLDLVFETGVAVHNALTLKVASVLSNTRYASFVVELRVCHSTKAGPRSPSQTPAEAQAQGWSLAASVIKACPKLVTLDWRAAFGIGGDVWDAISESVNLRKLSILPPLTHAAQKDAKTPRVTPCRSSSSDSRRGWELGDVWNGFQDLELTGLSAIGTKALASHLRQLAERAQQPPLMSLSVSTTFMDAPLCSAIGNVGAHGLLRRLELSTSGSKLSTDVFIGLLEGCVGLRELVMNDVQGRLDRDVWEGIEYPETLRKLIIKIPDDGQHHSWTHAHLTSIHRAPLSQLTHFAIHRLVPPLATVPRAPNVASLRIPVVNDFCHPKPIPAELISSLAESGSSIRHLSLDWWECSPSDVEQLARGCGKLQELELLLDCPMSKLLALATPFSNLHELNRLLISVSAENAKHPDSDLLAVAVRGSPTKMPASKAPNDNPDLPGELTRLTHAPDPAIPNVKDIRKFVRRLPCLSAIIWEGRGGKGIWRVTRSEERKSGSDISFEHAAIGTLEIWRQAQEAPPVWDFPEEVLSVNQVEDFEALNGGSSFLSPSSTVLATPLNRSGSTPALDALQSPSSRSSSPQKPPRRLSLPDDSETAKPRESVGLGLSLSGRQTNTGAKRQSVSHSPTKPTKPALPKSPGRSESPSPKKIITANGWRMAGTTKKKPKAKKETTK